MTGPTSSRVARLVQTFSRTVGSLDRFTYGDSIVAAGTADIIWHEEKLATYVTDPTEWLKEVLGNVGAKSKMTFKLKKNLSGLGLACAR